MLNNSKLRKFIEYCSISQYIQIHFIELVDMPHSVNRQQALFLIFYEKIS